MVATTWRWVGSTAVCAALAALVACGGGDSGDAPTEVPAGPSVPSGAALGGLPAAPIMVEATVGQTVIRTLALRNDGSAALDFSVQGGDGASGMAPRAATLAAAAGTELRAAIACDGDGSRRVTFTLQSGTPGTPSGTIDFDVRCTTPAVRYDGPLTITRGGTYSGNWESTDPAVAAVSIRTTEPVVIENCRVRGPGNLIASRFSASDSVPFADVTIRNCVGQGTGGLDVERGRGHFFIGVWPRRVVAQNNYYADTTGIWVIGNQEPGLLEELRIADNRVRNVTGGHNAIAIIEVTRTPDAELAWNEMINEPDRSYQEDVILTYKVLGSAADPFRVHSNFVDGAYSRNPRLDPSTGSGINIGDGDRGSGNESIHGYDNHIVRPVNVGTFIAAGSNNLLYGNRVLRSGLLPDGSRIDHRFTGLYVWDCCYGHVPNGIFFDNVARDNEVAYESVDAQGKVTRHEDKLDDCAKDAQGRTLCTGNTSPPGRVTPAMEDAERVRWLDRVAARGEPLGPR
jgi:hypothetical protein